MASLGSSAALAGRRSLTTMTVNPAKASKITARAQNTWHRLAARSRSCVTRPRSAQLADGLHNLAAIETYVHVGFGHHGWDDSGDARRKRCAVASAVRTGSAGLSPHLVGDVEHDHGVVGGAGTELVGSDRLAELDDPLARQGNHAKRPKPGKQRRDREVRQAQHPGERAGTLAISGKISSEPTIAIGMIGTWARKAAETNPRGQTAAACSDRRTACRGP